MAAATKDQTLELSISLPRALDTRIHIRLCIKSKVILVSLTTAAHDDVGAAANMGSFVYALPDRYNETQPLATTLYSQESSLEFTIRLAKLVARKAHMPVYVTNSISFANAGMGGTVEEEMEAFKAIVQVTLQKLREAGVGGAAAAMNGLSLHESTSDVKGAA